MPQSENACGVTQRPDNRETTTMNRRSILALPAAAASAYILPAAGQSRIQARYAPVAAAR